MSRKNWMWRWQRPTTFSSRIIRGVPGVAWTLIVALTGEGLAWIARNQEVTGRSTLKLRAACVRVEVAEIGVIVLDDCPRRRVDVRCKDIIHKEAGVGHLDFGQCITVSAQAGADATQSDPARPRHGRMAPIPECLSRVTSRSALSAEQMTGQQ
eukprot:11228295-Lingulodinium_polyedra.AAC.1